MQTAIWGIDLGGTKIEGVILPSLDDPKPILRKRVPTEAEKGYPHIVAQIGVLVRQMIGESGLTPDRIGIGTPGVLDPLLLTMKNCNSTALNGNPLQADLEKELGVSVILANDANCFALAETHWGAIRQNVPDAQLVFGIILGTGVGGGIVHHGQIWNGKHGIAGEWGHIFLDDSGGTCYCGRAGCVETILSGPSLQRYYTSQSGLQKTLKEIVRLAETGDAAAGATIDRLHFYFGKAVSIITNLLDPDAIIVGGGVGNIASIYGKGRESLEQHIFNNRLDTPILPPVLGDSAGVFGAAALVADQN